MKHFAGSKLFYFLSWWKDFPIPSSRNSLCKSAGSSLFLRKITPLNWFRLTVLKYIIGLLRKYWQLYLTVYLLQYFALSISDFWLSFLPAWSIHRLTCKAYFFGSEASRKQTTSSFKSKQPQGRRIDKQLLEIRGNAARDKVKTGHTWKEICSCCVSAEKLALSLISVCEVNCLQCGDRLVLQITGGSTLKSLRLCVISVSCRHLVITPRL